MKRRLLAWAALFFAFRLLCLYFFADAAFTPEEAYRGSMAVELSRFFHGQTHLPLSCLPPDSYLGGSLVTAFLTALNYQWLGLSLFTLKLTSLLFALASLLISYAWLYRRFGRAAADCFAALYTFAPPTFLFLGALSMGYHTESVAFLSAMIALADSGAFLGLGLVGGFAFWFSNLNGIGLLAALTLAPRALRGGRFYAGLIIGLLPWLGSARTGGEFFLSSIGVQSPGAKFWALITQILPLASGLATPYAYLYAALLLAAALSPLRRMLGTYLALFAAFYCLGRFGIDPAREDPVQFRYLQPLWVLVFLGVATAPKRVAITSALTALALLGIVTFPLVAPPGRAWRYSGIDAAALSARAMNSCFSELQPLLAWIDSSPTKEERALRNLPFLLAFDYSKIPAGAPLPQSNPLFARGFGAAHALDPLAFAGRVPAEPYWRGVAEATPENLSAEAYAHVPPTWFAFSRALHRHAPACFRGQPMSAEHETWALRGQGAAVADCGVTPEGIRARAEALAAGMDESSRNELAWGLGWQLRFRYAPDALRTADRILLLPLWARHGAGIGASAWERDLN
jgi:hypothetical protein